MRYDQILNCTYLEGTFYLSSHFDVCFFKLIVLRAFDSTLYVDAFPLSPACLSGTRSKLGQTSNFCWSLVGWDKLSLIIFYCTYNNRIGQQVIPTW